MNFPTQQAFPRKLSMNRESRGGGTSVGTSPGALGRFEHQGSIPGTLTGKRLRERSEVAKAPRGAAVANRSSSAGERTLRKDAADTREGSHQARQTYQRSVRNVGCPSQEAMSAKLHNAPCPRCSPRITPSFPPRLSHWLWHLPDNAFSPELT